MTGWLAALSLAAGALGAQAGAPMADRVTADGRVSVLGVAVPGRDAVELRPEIVAGVTVRLGRAVRIRAEGLLAALGGVRDRDVVGDLVARPQEAWIEAVGRRAELRAGFGRLVWGRLDELQPSDVINPIDATRFLLHGRSEARLPVAYVRGRLFASESLSVEGVLVPWFRRARFDELDEATSPFNLERDGVVPTPFLTMGGVVHREPDAGWENLSGGGRVSVTLGRVDVSGALYRGFDASGPVVFEAIELLSPTPFVVGRLVEYHPRFTMAAADVETVTGDWAWRGEVAIVDRRLAGRARPGLVDGRRVDAGAGFDRRAGSARVFGTLVVSREWSSEDPAIDRTDLSMLGSIERGFRRDRYRVRAFAAVNPGDRSAFLRGLFWWDVRDNVTLEWSGGAFLGSGDDLISRFANRDFILGRVTYAF